MGSLGGVLAQLFDEETMRPKPGPNAFEACPRGRTVYFVV
jgi:hypothetical protein